MKNNKNKKVKNKKVTEVTNNIKEDSLLNIEKIKSTVNELNLANKAVESCLNIEKDLITNRAEYAQKYRVLKNKLIMDLELYLPVSERLKVDVLLKTITSIKQ